MKYIIAMSGSLLCVLAGIVMGCSRGEDDITSGSPPIAPTPQVDSSTGDTKNPVVSYPLDDSSLTESLTPVVCEIPTCLDELEIRLRGDIPRRYQLDFAGDEASFYIVCIGGRIIKHNFWGVTPSCTGKRVKLYGYAPDSFDVIFTSGDRETEYRLSPSYSTDSTTKFECRDLGCRSGYVNLDIHK